MEAVFKLILCISILAWASAVTMMICRINAREKRLIRMLTVGRPEFPNPPSPLSADDLVEFGRKVGSYNCSRDK